MHTPSAQPSGRLFAVLATLVAVLATAFVLAPHTLAATRATGGFSEVSTLRRTLRQAFAEYWSSGERDPTPGLQTVIDYWSRYHLVKAAIAVILLIVLIVLGVVVWKAFSRSGGLRAAAFASAGVLVTMLALSCVLLVVANIQGAVAPFASLLPMLAAGGSGGRLGDTLGQVRQRLADSSTTGPLEVMISDFVRYHAAMAVAGAVVVAVFAGLSVASWRWLARTPRSDRRTRRVLGSYGVLSAVFPLFMGVVVMANTATAMDPAPALLAFFEGGW
ncbi:hypothetical protein [Planobispora takensis]|uniref:Uncharacterized protein n=1 Tax=Planobispora takensis TaxID=1367882 RepID=A0A8J3WXH9_9ACTN|nr:hypothetical protein [Planobispora takensis]GII05260.1 hypothetical protein Pta02_72680 [Planobispora takensis]